MTPNNRFSYKYFLTLFIYISLISNIGISQFVYNSGYECFMLVKVLNYSSCNMYVHKYSFGSPMAKGYKYAELSFVDGLIDSYKKNYIDLNYYPIKESKLIDILIKFDYHKGLLSQIKTYNSNGALYDNLSLEYLIRSDQAIQKITTINVDTISIKLSNTDQNGFLSYLYLPIKDKLNEDNPLSITSSLEKSGILNICIKDVITGEGDNVENFTFDGKFNLMTYKLYYFDTQESMYGIKKAEVIRNRFRLEYIFDDIGNPTDVILFNEMDEPEYKFTFEYFN